jgi:AraC-like DNA-binding protein
MVLILAIIGVLLSVILLYYPSRNFSSAGYLGLFFLGVSLYGLYQYVLVSSKSVTMVSYSLLLIPFFGSIIYLIGPLLYWYVRSVLTDRSTFRKSDLLHLIPMVIFFLAALPNLFGAWPDKVEGATAIVNDANAMEFYKPTLLSGIFSYPVMFISRPVLILFYTSWSIIIFIRFLIRRKEMKVLSGQRFMLRWLPVLLTSLLILVVSHTFLAIDFTLTYTNFYATLTILKILSLTGLMVLLLSPLFFPEVLYGLPRIPEITDIQKRSATKVPVKQPEKSKSEPHFETDYLNLIREKSTACMRDLQPFLQPEFNLAQLSVLIRVPVHHLAYYFREVKKMPFTDFRNRWRVNHAKNLILEGKFNDLTLEAIGLLSGFTSRNTFLNAFKKAEGISPNAFLSEIKKK